MKKTKKLSAFLLALAMVMALVAVPAFAADGDDETQIDTAATTSITVVPQDNGEHTYSAYPIFKGTLSASGVLSEVEWADGVNGAAILNALKAATDENFKNTEGDNIFANCQSAADVAETIASFDDDTDAAQALASFFETNQANLGTPIPLNNKSQDGYPYATVPAGYYLVLETTENAGDNKTRAILNVANDEQIQAKVDGVATVTKVAGDISYGIGDEIPYTVTVSLKDYQENAEEYAFTLTDTFGKNLEPVFTTGASSSDIKDGVTITLGDINGTDITTYFHISYNSIDNVMTVVAYRPTDGENNLVGIDGLTLSNESKIVLRYKAKLVNSYDGQDGTVNRVQYNTSVTVPEYIYPINLTVQKVNGADVTEPLDGAQFKLRAENNKYAQINGTNNVTAWTENENEAAVLTTTENGTFTVKGLKAGTYYLTEIVAPDGYNLPVKDFTLVIAAEENGNGNGLETLTISVDDGTITNGDTATNTVTAVIANNKGATLPSTGGMGTTVFYVIGAILVVGAVVLLVTRRRMSE